VDSCISNGSTGEGSHDFARARRIVKTDEFSSVFRLRPAQKSAHFVLYTRLNTLPHARLGVVVAKRFAPRAATRNTIKRVTRELFRTTGLPAIDCVVRLSRPVNSKEGPATSAQLKAELRLELVRLFASQNGKAADAHAPAYVPVTPAVARALAKQDAAKKAARAVAKAAAQPAPKAAGQPAPKTAAKMQDDAPAETDTESKMPPAAP
jgi:ribonuclease P protein component